jgi:mannose-6-phosphate isomerase-like protein (cupin superfamily)
MACLVDHGGLASHAVPKPTYVCAERELEATVADGDTATVRVAFDAGTGSEALEQRLVRFAVGRSAARGPGEREEALFVLEGGGTLLLDGTPHALQPETAVRIAPGQRYAVDNPGPGELALVSVLVPAAAPAPRSAAAVVRLADQDAREATSDRAFRVLLDPERGLTGGTQFVGVIPSKRAPEHYHHYDEVIYVLEGEGVLHVGGEHTPIGPASCIHLRPCLRHCLESTGPDDMRVVALFRPAGDPSEAYLPDGERATVERSAGR